MQQTAIKISIITPLYNTPEDYLKDMIHSVQNQTYTEWELCLADASDEEHGYVGEICNRMRAEDERIRYTKLSENGGISVNSNECVKLATGNYIGVLDHDDILHQDALRRVAEVIRSENSEFVYTDETKFSEDISHAYGENYKPDFGLDELRAHNYICHFNVFSKALFESVGGYRKEFDGSQDHDLVLRLCEKAKNIRHIPEILYYWRVHSNSVASGIGAKSYAINAAVKAVQESLDRNGEIGKARNTIEGSRYKVDYLDTYTPNVDIVVLSRDRQYVERIIEEMDNTANYCGLKYIVLLDSTEQEIRSEHEVIYTEWESWKSVIHTEFVVFVQENIMRFSMGWLQELLVLAQDERIGCVGMKATDEAGHLWHTRVIYDGEQVRIPYYGQPDGTEGYEAELTLTRNTSMLDGGVLLISGKTAGYLNENDSLTDFAGISFRLFAKGLRNVYTPYGCVAMAAPHEIENRAGLVRQWETLGLEIDPFYNIHIKELGVDREVTEVPKSNGLSGADKCKAYYQKIAELGKLSVFTLKNEGIKSFVNKTKNYIEYVKCSATTQLPLNGFVSGSIAYRDVLFISGCGKEVPHPHRYRVTHQKEQLESRGIRCDDLFYLHLSLERVRYYTTFIFYRCPYTDIIGEFIRLAKEQKKTVLYDVDDLVIDTKYTDTIPYVQTLQKQERSLYDDGVNRMGRTLKLCDGAITTTERLAEELSHYVPEVFINRNNASEEMLECSNEAYRQYKDGRIILKDSSVEIVPNPSEVLIGYFSGSITHNADFEIVLPALVQIMKDHTNVKICVVGELELPEELQIFKDRIISYPFVDYKELPKLIRAVDINIAPIELTVFNEAKSENKWVEAALVRVPTVASNVGAFQVAITDGVTGLLCENTEASWYQALSRMVEDRKLREEIAENAYAAVMKNYITTHSASHLAEYIRRKRAKTFAMVLPSTQISGGIMVALKHCEIMRKKGYNVLIIASNPTRNYMESGSEKFPVIHMEKEPVEAYIEKMVATMWVTVNYVLSHPTTESRYYLVQNLETDFYRTDRPERRMAFETYNKSGFIKYITISRWCQKWLQDDFAAKAFYAPNGLDVEAFYPVRRTMEGRIRILIEGDSAVDYKNVDESFAITNKLDKDRFEVWYLSYNGNPKKWYQYDKFIQKVPYAEMPHIYRQCDILLKSSKLESFSYPPLEMMSTGGFAVVAPNDGNAEYLVHGENCLLYKPGDIEDGVRQIMMIAEDAGLRDRLYEGAQKTAAERKWESVEADILELYDM